MTATVPALLQPLKDRLAAATPGPWEERVDDLTDDVDVVHDQEQVSFVASCGDKHGPRVLADAEFIAAAPTDQAKLIAAIEAVTEVHQPCRYRMKWPYCSNCVSTLDGEPEEWPCITIKALTQALGGDTA